MNRVYRASLVLLMLPGAIVPDALFTPATAHQVPAFIKEFSGSRIRESDIRKILNAMEAAANRKDVDGILKYMAPNITIKITVQLGAGAQQLSLSREQYRQYLQQGFATTERRSGNYTNLKIQVAPNGQTATATYTLREEATLKGQPGTFVSTSQETVKFARIKGQLLETAATSNAMIEVK
ncbi:MAG: nuclear transport factor 2 family protein [Stenomitos rutilans HA7619-LM2]|jgi:ketosteroid isomerase-like protein|nr:nuclear transport factor 2 family protein [Stenomitos rutilans HA7619-LM2]